MGGWHPQLLLPVRTNLGINSPVFRAQKTFNDAATSLDVLSIDFNKFKRTLRVQLINKLKYIEKCDEIEVFIRNPTNPTNNPQLHFNLFLFLRLYNLVLWHSHWMSFIEKKNTTLTV
ncbi:unnamed protein product [Callosobruchus maculatus]|uniref:Uncharacterized protein n=1 Tax=Callosobruchus maculatus TaxID=64391 RepID=A0A653BLY8_CALMS|nr:unnamed protein product [Callosobruchus maculatus]